MANDHLYVAKKQQKGESKMQAILRRTKQFLCETDGPTATEYAVMLALIIIVAITAISSLGTKVSGIFSAVDATLVVPGAAS